MRLFRNEKQNIRNDKALDEFNSRLDTVEEEID